MNERWTVENLDRGKFMIRREDHRCIAIVSFVPKSDVFEDDVLKLFTNSNRLFMVCKKILAWHDYGTMNLQTAISGLHEIIEDIEGGKDVQGDMS